MSYGYTQPYYNPCYPTKYGYNAHPSYPPNVSYSHPGYRGYQTSYPSYPPNYPALTYPSQSYPKSSAIKAFSLIKPSAGDDVYAINDYDTLTLTSLDTTNLIVTGDKANRKITMDLSGVVTTTGTTPSGAITIQDTTDLVTTPLATQTLVTTTAVTLLTTEACVKVTNGNVAVADAILSTAGAIDGQHLTVITEMTSTDIVFAASATSRIAGTRLTMKPLQAYQFIYNGPPGTAMWHPIVGMT
jgi:hypothetical protein